MHSFLSELFSWLTCVWRITDFPRISNSPHTRSAMRFHSGREWTSSLGGDRWNRENPVGVRLRGDGRIVHVERTSVSHEERMMRFTITTVSSQAARPALKTQLCVWNSWSHLYQKRAYTLYLGTRSRGIRPRFLRFLHAIAL